MVSTFSMLNYGPQRRLKCHKTLSCNFFGVIQQFDSTNSDLIVICFDFGGLLGLYVDLYSCLRFVLNEKTRQYSTATNTIYIRAFHLPNGCSTMWLYQCWSSLGLKLFTVGADIIRSGNEFQLFITLLLKQCCRIVV